MSLSKTVYDALKAVLTTESRLAGLSEQVAAVSDKVESNAARLSAIVENHAERLARLEGKFELLENTLSSRRRRLPRSPPAFDRASVSRSRLAPAQRTGLVRRSLLDLRRRDGGRYRARQPHDLPV